MTLATMADRSLPLAERVQAALLCCDMDDAHEAARAALLADVAAADRLARADAGYWDWVGGDPDEWGIGEAHIDALAAYRARMQGVARG